MKKKNKKSRKRKYNMEKLNIPSNKIQTRDNSPVTINIYNNAPQNPQQNIEAKKSFWNWLLSIIGFVGGLLKVFSTS